MMKEPQRGRLSAPQRLTKRRGASRLAFWNQRIKFFFGAPPQIVVFQASGTLFTEESIDTPLSK
jgi:hypothetical protein